MSRKRPSTTRGVQKLSERVKTLRAVLSNPDISSYRPVVNPERMVIKEALRAETYLALFGYPIDGVICNRVIQPADYQDTYNRKDRTQEHSRARSSPSGPATGVGCDAARPKPIRG